MEKVYKRNASSSYLVLIMALALIIFAFDENGEITGNGWLKVIVGILIFLYSLWEVIVPIAKIVDKELILKPTPFSTKTYSLAKTSILFEESNGVIVFTQDGKSFSFKVKLIRSSMRDEFIADIRHFEKMK